MVWLDGVLFIVYELFGVGVFLLVFEVGEFIVLCWFLMFGVVWGCMLFILGGCLGEVLVGLGFGVWNLMGWCLGVR